MLKVLFSPVRSVKYGVRHITRYSSFFIQLKSFHNELLTELEKKVELDARYLNVSLLF